jgi:ubiquinone/menaquinone biosynthesis C-methylase UbiE
MTTSGTSGPAYALRGGRNETRRLGAQASDVRAHTEALLEPVELPPDASAIDLGCGPGGALDVLSERVGPGGQVIGVDNDPRNVRAARAFAQERRLANVEIIRADARDTGLATSSYDLVHARFLLVNIPSPEQVVAEMARLARPGGWVTLMEPDVALRLCHPHHAGVERLSELLAAGYTSQGADPYVGRRLPHLLATEGLIEIRAEARAELSPRGHAQRSVIPDLVQNMRAKILEQGLIEERDLVRLDREARLHLDDPDTFSIPVTYLLASARKSGTAA